MFNYRASVIYDGGTLSGWQRQKNSPETVQEYLEEAIKKITGEETKVIGAGRTDAGVHSKGQVSSFLLEKDWPAENLIRAINDHIHKNIALVSLNQVPLSFNALRDAQMKWYRYRILNRRVRCPFRTGYVYFCPFNLDLETMLEAAGHIQGEHDFTSFCAARSTAATRTRNLEVLELYPNNDEIIIDFKAKGFLYKMVRNIAGTLVQVGRGRMKPEEIPQILQGRDRRLAGPTAPAYGLTLMEVQY